MVYHYMAINTITSTTTSSTQPDWPYWHNSIITSTSSNGSSNTTSTGIWPQWHDSIIVSEGEFIQAIETERARRKILHQEYEERERILREERKEIEKKAQQILLDHLTPDQKEAVEKNGWFVIEGGISKKKYKIRIKTVAGNVEEIDDKGIVVAKYCCHLSQTYPSPDHHLTQKLMLEWEEDTFLRIANKTLVG